MVSSRVGTIFLPADTIGAMLSLGLRKFGNRMIDGINVANPLPAIIKIA